MSQTRPHTAPAGMGLSVCSISSSFGCECYLTGYLRRAKTWAVDAKCLPSQDIMTRLPAACRALARRHGAAWPRPPRRRGRAAMRESRPHADPPLTTTYRRRLSPRSAGKAVHSGLDLSLASRRLPGFHLRQWGGRSRRRGRSHRRLRHRTRCRLRRCGRGWLFRRGGLGGRLLGRNALRRRLAGRGLTRGGLFTAWGLLLGAGLFCSRPCGARTAGGLACTRFLACRAFLSTRFRSHGSAPILICCRRRPTAAGACMQNHSYRSKLAVPRGESIVFFIIRRWQQHLAMWRAHDRGFSTMHSSPTAVVNPALQP